MEECKYIDENVTEAKKQDKFMRIDENVTKPKKQREKEGIRKCDMCDKEFSKSGNLKRHLHVCDICTKPFCKISDLKKHTETVHELSLIHI